MKKVILFFGLAVILIACGDSDTIEVGNRTTMEVNSVFDGGKVLKGETIEAIFTIKNTGDYPLVIAEVKGSCTCTVVEKPDEPISPGDSFVIKAEVDTDRTSSGQISKGVTIVANTDPSITTVAIKATVLEK
ncbi:MAG: DUF1573 domain-containing protein [Bacteroidetes bacterium]|nr:DUF1573 domain-containing protein [Bacteroidota bacterium]